MTEKRESNSYDSTDVETTAGSDLDVSTNVEHEQIPSAPSSILVEGWSHHASSTATPPSSAGVAPHNSLRRAWDDYDAYLFDIDGTLLHCKDAVHYFAFCDVLTRTAGRPLNLDGIPVQGKIDPGILRDAFNHAGIPEQQWRPQLQSLLEQMGDHVEAHAADFNIEVLPGVREALTHLQQRGKLLGVGTGNLQRIGWAKLSHCGLRDFFTLGGFSDHYEVRGDMIAGAAAQARAMLNQPKATVLVLGDTPGDITAARFAGVDVIAIATGIYTADQLQSADLVVDSMRDLV